MHVFYRAVYVVLSFEQGIHQSQGILCGGRSPQAQQIHTISLMLIKNVHTYSIVSAHEYLQ